MPKYFFHLFDHQDVILDSIGVEVADLAEARTEALEAIEELRRESPSLAEDWRDWRMEVVDASGNVAFTIRLDDCLP